jgi:hypothetical protein
MVSRARALIKLDEKGGGGTGGQRLRKEKSTVFSCHTKTNDIVYIPPLPHTSLEKLLSLSSSSKHVFFLGGGGGYGGKWLKGVRGFIELNKMRK